MLQRSMKTLCFWGKIVNSWLKLIKKLEKSVKNWHCLIWSMMWHLDTSFRTFLWVFSSKYLLLTALKRYYVDWNFRNFFKNRQKTSKNFKKCQFWKLYQNLQNKYIYFICSYVSFASGNWKLHRRKVKTLKTALVNLTFTREICI